MSGTPFVKRPKNNAEWARNTEKRQNAVEHPTSQRIGPWTLSAHPESGALIASHVNGGSLVLATPPEPSDEAGADEVSATKSAVTLTRTTNQAIAATATAVQWEDVRADIGGWTTGVLTGGLTEVTVPISGLYFMSSTVHFQAGGGLLAVAIRINGATQLVTNMVENVGGSWPSVVVSGQLPLLEGDTLSVVTVRTAGASNIGGNIIATPVVPTIFSAHLVSAG
jgi:hypothetical protein